MSLAEARRYRTVSRTMLPLAGLWVAGFALGRAVYLGTGHLGLYWGPLGEIRRAFLAVPPWHRMPAGGWLDLVTVAVFGGVLLAEMRRQQTRRADLRQQLLFVGYILMAVEGPLAFAGRSVPEAVVIASSVGAGAALAAARWRVWRPQLQLAAVGLATVAAILAVVLARMQDAVRLGQGGRAAHW